MIRALLARSLFLAPAIALLALISLAAPVHAQTASCDVLSGNAGPAWNPGSYGVGGSTFDRYDDTGYTDGASGSDSAAQSACQSFSQNNALSGVCQDSFTYVQGGWYLDYSSPEYYLCQYEICADVTETYQWNYNFYPNVNSITYSPPTSYNADSFDGTWHQVNHGSGQSDASVCTYTPPPSPPTASIYASPQNITQGQGTTLIWGSSNASSCTGTNFSTGGAPSGAIAIYPSTSTSYWVTCYGPGGSTVAGTTVGVTPLPDIATTALPTLTLTAGQSYPFSGTIYNVGAGNAGGFWNTLRICTNGCTPYDDHAQQAWIGGLGAGGSTGISITDTAPSTPGAYYYIFYAGYNNAFAASLSEPNYSNNAASWGVLNVVQADLVTTGTPPTLTLSPGQSYSFTGTITNAGNGATSGGFWNDLRICTSGCTPYDDHSQETWLNALGPGASTAVAVTGTAPTTPGTYYYQIYPNTNTGLANVVAESNYSNDYTGAWGTMTVINPTPTCSLSANPSTISPNQSTTLTWSSTNTSSCTGSGFSTGGAANGSTSVTPGALPTSYGLSCTGGGGTCNATPVTLSNSCVSGSLAMTMTVASTLVPSGTNVTFNWSASNVQGSSCTVTGSDGYNQTIPTNACSVPAGQNTTVVTHQTTYTITCDGTSKAITVNVPPGFQEF